MAKAKTKDMRDVSITDKVLTPIINELRLELQLLISTSSTQPFSGSISVAADGVKLEAKRLTAAQVRAIVDILGG